MADGPHILSIPAITNDGQGASHFSQREIALNGDISRQLSEQISAVNFRLRRSENYEASFHVAGDPTLLIVLSGTMRISLPNGQSRDFTQGDMYIAQDYLAVGAEFEAGVHGHSAQTVGDVPYNAVHLKLSRRQLG